MKHNNARWYLGIDGGGTKTDFALADEQGRLLAREKLGPCNPVDLGMGETLRVLAEGIARVCAGRPLSEISVYAGIAGGITGENQRLIREPLASCGFFRAENGTDAMNAVAAGLGDQDGVAVILGTGSIAFAKQGETLMRLGGFGYLLEPGGSGFAIGRDGILAALQAEEGSKPHTLLLPLVREKCGRAKVLDAVGDFYQGGKRLLASYAPLVFEAARQGDPAAAAILQENMRPVAELLTAGAKKLSGSGPVQGVLLGGLVHQKEVLGPLLESLLPPGQFDLRWCLTPPVAGALRLAGLSSPPEAALAE